jgi:hypothetical protein
MLRLLRRQAIVDEDRGTYHRQRITKRVGLDGVRCASLLQQQEPLLDMLRVLNQHFGHDPEVLYLTVHAYSDLSSDAARELALTAPTSIPALEMDAEANERQGKWDDAEKTIARLRARIRAIRAFTSVWHSCFFPGRILGPTSRPRRGTTRKGSSGGRAKNARGSGPQ